MNKFLCILGLACSLESAAQTFNHYITTEKTSWQKSTQKLEKKASTTPLMTVSATEKGHEFRAWGTCFNELNYDALLLLKPEEREKIMHDVFSPDGDLKFTRGRLTMNANDYSRSWYQCDSVAGDFQLRYFNIERDKQVTIPLVRMAQKYQPDITFWMSPWSPPSWMKINQDYPVMPSPSNSADIRQEYLLFGTIGDLDPTEVEMAGTREGKFPKRLASQDYMIQDPRYLQAYANMFSRFIDLYKEQGIPIDMVMYQNEAYSYTAYPGCAWTADGTILFNRDYLVPTIKKNNPDVDVYIGTFNTNRRDYVEKIVGALAKSDDGSKLVKGVGLQWEGRENLDYLREKYPDLHLISTESECGKGRFDWRSGEHTFYLLHEYIGRGCNEYFIWNFILPDRGRSSWGWNQNSLIHVDSKNRTFRYTAEYYAVKHFSHFVEPGSTIVGFYPWNKENAMQAIAFRNPDGKYIVIAGSTSDKEQTLTFKLGSKYLNVSLPPHSFNSFVEK